MLKIDIAQVLLSQCVISNQRVREQAQSREVGIGGSAVPAKFCRYASQAVPCHSRVEALSVSAIVVSGYTYAVFIKGRAVQFVIYLCFKQGIACAAALACGLIHGADKGVGRLNVILHKPLHPRQSGMPTA